MRPFSISPEDARATTGAHETASLPRKHTRLQAKETVTNPTSISAYSVDTDYTFPRNETLNRPTSLIVTQIGATDEPGASTTETSGPSAASDIGRADAAESRRDVAGGQDQEGAGAVGCAATIAVTPCYVLARGMERERYFPSFVKAERYARRIVADGTYKSGDVGIYLTRFGREVAIIKMDALDRVWTEIDAYAPKGLS